MFQDNESKLQEYDRLLSDRNHLLHKYSFALNFYRNNTKSLSSESFENEINKSATEFSESNKISDKFKSCNNYQFRKRSRKHESSSELCTQPNFFKIENNEGDTSNDS